jgi:sulfate transport system substrate-binding protein
MKKLMAGLAALVVLVGTRLPAAEPARNHSTVELVNLSSYSTRDLWQDLNRRFSARYARETGTAVRIQQSHGDSQAQLEAVLKGQPADVLTLGAGVGLDQLRQKGLLAEGWEYRLPHQSVPYTSAVVFLVRKGNPRHIRDWPDLLKPDVRVLTPNPKSSAGGRINFLAAWGAVLQRGGSEDQARAFVARLYRQVPALESSAREALAAFVRKGAGDVLLAQEYEVRGVAKGSGGDLEIIYPPISLRTEPRVAVLDRNAERRDTQAAAEAYLRFLYTDEAQEVIARHGYRPVRAGIARANADRLPEVELFSLQDLAGNRWQLDERFFAEGGIFDQVRAARK